MGHVEDVVDDLEGEAGGFAEGAEAGEECRWWRMVSCPRPGWASYVAEAEEAAADDAGGDEGAGFGAVDLLDELGGGLVVFGLDVDDLAADHAGRDAGGGSYAGADGEGEVVEDGDDGGGWGGEIGDDLEGEVLEGVAGEDGDGFSEGYVAGGLAAAEVVVVEGGEVVVDEGVGVGHFDGGAEVGCACGDSGRVPGATMRAASMQRMGRRRLPPAKVEWRMARWMEWGSVVAEGRRRSSAASVRVTPEVRMSCTAEFMVTVILRSPTQTAGVERRGAESGERTAR